MTSNSEPPLWNKKQSDYLDKPLPSNNDAEDTIIGSIILNNDLADVIIIAGLKPEDCYNPRNRRILSAIIQLRNESKQIDPITIGEILKIDGSLDSMGGITAITQLTMGVPHFADISEYVNIVEEKAKLRKLIKICNGIAVEALSEEQQFQELIQQVESEVYGLSEDSVTQGLQKVSLATVESIEMAKIRGQSNSVITGLATGFTDLDHKLQGLRKGEMVVVAARPSVGKTAFGFSLAQNVAFRNHGNVLVFSIEMGKGQITERIICSEANISTSRYRAGQLAPQEWAKVDEIQEMINDSNLYIDDSPMQSVSTIRSKIRRAARELNHDIDLILVDYIGLVEPEGRYKNNREADISGISRGFKMLAREFDTTVMPLAQMNREVEKRSNHRPNLSDLRESGAIEQDADVVAFIYREDLYITNPEEHTNIAELIVAKNRNGPTGQVSMMFDPPTTSFRNLALGY